MNRLEAFQSFLYAQIPLVKNMQLKLKGIDTQALLGNAPIAPNINDKLTVFGGSSAALMTICGWSLIKYHLESNQVFNDVVVHRSNTHWHKAQTDDLNIKATTTQKIDWSELADRMKSKNRTTKVQIQCQVHNQEQQMCTEMEATYVILKNTKA